jgi:ABC transporter substrate binding protein
VADPWSTSLPSPRLLSAIDRSAYSNGLQTIPIVFAQVVDPVSSGFVESLARPGGNVTGFASLYRSKNTIILARSPNVVQTNPEIAERDIRLLGD